MRWALGAFVLAWWLLRRRDTGAHGYVGDLGTVTNLDTGQRTNVGPASYAGGEIIGEDTDGSFTVRFPSGKVQTFAADGKPLSSIHDDDYTDTAAPESVIG